jgi:hypothetical protein
VQGIERRVQRRHTCNAPRAAKKRAMQLRSVRSDVKNRELSRETAATPNTRRPEIRPSYSSNLPLSCFLCAHSTFFTKANLPRYCACRCASFKCKNWTF